MHFHLVYNSFWFHVGCLVLCVILVCSLFPKNQVAAVEVTEWVQIRNLIQKTVENLETRCDQLEQRMTYLEQNSFLNFMTDPVPVTYVEFNERFDLVWHSIGSLLSAFEELKVLVLQNPMDTLLGDKLDDVLRSLTELTEAVKTYCDVPTEMLP